MPKWSDGVGLDGTGQGALFATDLSSDPFYTTEGWYGAAADGKWYYNGNQCAPGSLLFGSGTTPNRTCWPQWSQTPPFDYGGRPGPDDQMIGSDPGGTATVSGGVLTLAGNLSGGYAGIGGYPGWAMVGDFDISIQFENLAFTGGTYGGLYLIAQSDLDNQAYCSRNATQNRHNFRFRDGGSLGTNHYISAGGETEGGIRIVRSGLGVSGYYNVGGGWTKIGDTETMTRADPMYVGINLWGSDSFDVSVDVTEFAMSASSINEAPWFTSIGKPFPLRPIFVATDESLNILDTDTGALWARFEHGTGYVFDPAWSSGSTKWTHHVTMRQGMIVAAYHGAMVVIDLSTGDVSVHRKDGDAQNGAPRQSTHGNQWPGWTIGAVTNSHIETRNSNNPQGTNEVSTWAVLDEDVNCCDLYSNMAVGYRVAGTESGLTVFSYERWTLFSLMLSADWDTANAVEWCAFDQGTQDLYWHDKTNTYSAALATWQAGIGGTFAADTTKALAGTLATRGQWRLAYYDGELFAAADEGIYVIDWPSGAWTLTYGKSGSGATYELDMSYDTCDAVTVVAHPYDSRAIITCSATDSTTYRIYQIDHSTNALKSTEDVTVKMGAAVSALAGTNG